METATNVRREIVEHVSLKIPCGVTEHFIGIGLARGGVLRYVHTPCGREADLLRRCGVASCAEVIRKLRALAACSGSYGAVVQDPEDPTHNIKPADLPEALRAFGTRINQAAEVVRKRRANARPAAERPLRARLLMHLLRRRSPLRFVVDEATKPDATDRGALTVTLAGWTVFYRPPGGEWKAQRFDREWKVDEKPHVGMKTGPRSKEDARVRSQCLICPRCKNKTYRDDEIKTHLHGKGHQQQIKAELIRVFEILKQLQQGTLR